MSNLLFRIIGVFAGIVVLTIGVACMYEVTEGGHFDDWYPPFSVPLLLIPFGIVLWGGSISMISLFKLFDMFGDAYDEVERKITEKKESESK